MSTEFQREDRYIVIKRSDMEKLPIHLRRNFAGRCRALHEQMFIAGAPARMFLVIESDWPEYEPVWKMIEARMTGTKAPLQADAQPEHYKPTVPKFKFDTLVEHCKRLERELAEARAHINEVTLYQQNAVWFWQHDGEDFLESLTCPIIIQPHHLRELIAGAKSDKCAWTYSDNEFSWDTQCGQKWSFTDGGTPAENGMNFCHSCGKGLVIPREGD